MGCTHANLEIPHLMRPFGDGRFVVDVGLGFDAGETLAAVNNGFNVIAFEMLPANILELKKRFRGDERFHFIELEKASTGWRFPVHVKAPPPLTIHKTSGRKPKKGSQLQRRGTAFIVHAGLAETSGTARMPKSSHKSYTNHLAEVKQDGGAVSGGGSSGSKTVEVAVARLDEVIPEWAPSIYLLKVDTQGWEHKVLAGAVASLEARRFSYVQYEFSPWLMNRSSTGDPVALAELLPSMGAVCFDTMTKGHNALPRPSTPLRAYVDRLNGGRHSEVYPGGMSENNPYGPWDDITCAFLGGEQNGPD
jgi:FkbM family methyltransferase